MRVLTVNAGSSSLKLRLLDADDRVLADETVERWDGEHDLGPLRAFLDEVAGVDAVGHRVVHGGPHHRAPAAVDPDLVASLEGLTDLAPLHQPRAVAGIRAVATVLPGAPAVACFDTAFHATLPPESATYALPAAWRARWGLRRYGFHGLSHAYASRRAAALLDRPVEGLRLVTCHLGSGASLAAVRDGRSVDTTMGFTPLAGLVMATRSGSVDPGMLVWLQRHGGLSLDSLEDGLEHRSGLAGLSGTSGDLRDVLAARASGDPDATLAYDVFTHRLSREIAAMTASTGGLDALVMTGGIGEHAPEVRAAVASRLDHLGLAVDSTANAGTTGDGDVSAGRASVRTLVVSAREDLEIARGTRRVLSPAGRPG
jgi:acetate kinase